VCCTGVCVCACVFLCLKTSILNLHIVSRANMMLELMCVHVNEFTYVYVSACVHVEISIFNRNKNFISQMMMIDPNVSFTSLCKYMYTSGTRTGAENVCLIYVQLSVLDPFVDRQRQTVTDTTQTKTQTKTQKKTRTDTGRVPYTVTHTWMALKFSTT